jgi:hypothetical protein
MKWAGGVVGLCGLAVPGWWIALFRSSTVRHSFMPPEAWPAFQAVLLPDLLLALASVIVAAQMLRGRPSAALFGATWGAWAYATAYSIGWARSVEASTLGPALMVSALGGLTAVWYAVVPARPVRNA